MRKVLTIVLKDLYITYTDRNLLLILLGAPLLLATIIGSAFSGFTAGGNDVPIRNIPVAVVNLDQSVDTNGTSLNLGQTFTELLVPADSTTIENNPLLDLTAAEVMADPAAARAAVDEGRYSAAVIIPANFTQSLTYSTENRDLRISPIEVYSSPAAPVGSSIIRSIAENFANQALTGSVTIAATIETLISRAQSDPLFGLQFAAQSSNGNFQPDFAAAFDPNSRSIEISQQTVSGEVATFNPLVVFGAAQALFFMTFTAIQSANSILEERRDGSLGRLLTSPTSRLTILLGKLLGAFVNSVVQVTLLFIALNLISIVLSGELRLIWGSNILLVLAVIVAGSLAACGVGAVVTALARTPEQVNIVGGLIAMFFGLFSGAFFNIQGIPQIAPIGRLTPNYWAVDAFGKLSQNQTDVGLNLAVLLGIGGVLFVLGTAIFNRRLNV